MKKIFFALMMISALLAVSGCGGGDHDDNGIRVVTRTIFSDPVADGDILLTPPNTFTISQDQLSLFAGEEPLVDEEWRAFLDFPLGEIPVDAIIDSATLSLVIRSIDPSNVSIPVVVELVAYPPTALGGADFNRAPLIDIQALRLITPSDVSPSGLRRVNFDVTRLMDEAQARAINFQVRIRQEGGQFPGVIEIDDDQFPPRLTVSYF